MKQNIYSYIYYQEHVINDNIEKQLFLLKAPLIKDEYNNMEEIVIHVVRINIITYKYHWQHCIKNNIAHIFSTIYDFIINFFQHFFFSTFNPNKYILYI